MRRRIVTAVTALMLAAKLGSTISVAQPSSDELSTIASYLDDNDVQGLRAYLKLHPELTQGSSSLANLLRRFLVESAAPNSFFKFDRNLSDSLGQQPSAGNEGPPSSAY